MLISESEEWFEDAPHLLKAKRNHDVIDNFIKID
jgi:hypothetical protein